MDLDKRQKMDDMASKLCNGNKNYPYATTVAKFVFKPKMFSLTGIYYAYLQVSMFILGLYWNIFT